MEAKTTSSLAYTATLCLVAIQVGIGVIMKLAQSNTGEYAFSPLASISISEFLKLCLSIGFFWLECQQRAAKRLLPKNLDSTYLPLAGQTGESEDRDDEDDAGERNNELSKGAPTKLTVKLFWNYFKGEMTSRTRLEISILALMYLLVNTTIFAAYKKADPGTISLIKSGVTVITALVSMASSGTNVSKLQWAAIFLQLCGLTVTQYRPGEGAAYPASTYLLLVLHVFLGATAGVYNQVLLKRDNASLNAVNLTLYAAGTVSNVAAHIIVRFVNPEEPEFFTGIGEISALMVITSNVLIGLAITAVYKYADAIMKCFATAFATSILLYISSILFGSYLTFMAIPGTAVVFIASWLYVTNPSSVKPTAGSELSIIILLSTIMRKWPRGMLAFATVQTIFVVILLWRPVVQTQTQTLPADTGFLESPFKNTLAYVRWNQPLPERFPWIMKYQPFFHTIHFASRGDIEGIPENFHNLTHDVAWVNNSQKKMAQTMKLILESHPDIEGIMYFHFDAWVRPMDFAGMDLKRPWFLFEGEPDFICTNNIIENWRNIDEQEKAIAAVKRLKKMKPPVIEEDGELISAPERYESDFAFCRGWADLYYVPRRFFPDYIYLTDNAFFTDEEDIFHEVSIATMMHMMDQTRSRSNLTSVLDPLACWGSCCRDKPTVKDVTRHRCGHKFDYRDEDVTNAHFGHLDQASLLLKRSS